MIELSTVFSGQWWPERKLEKLFLKIEKYVTGREGIISGIKIYTRSSREKSREKK